MMYGQLTTFAKVSKGRKKCEASRRGGFETRPYRSAPPQDEVYDQVYSSMSVVVVTGSGGLIGAEAARFFAALGLDVIGIDDSPSIRTIIKLYLMGRGLEFIEATDGAHGLQLAAERGVDLVIADFNMPVMNGIDFVQNLRAHENAALRVVPIILLTANKDDELRDRAMEVGVNAFAVKPISRDQLTTTVRQFLPLEEQSG